MTTIIMVAIGILLALFAAIMVIFWGGSGFQDGKTKAEAGRLVAESVQMEHAVDYYQAQNGGELPGQGSTASSTPTQALIDKKIMTNIPPGAVMNSTGDPTSWTIDYNDKMIYSDLGSDDHAKAICVAARKELHIATPETIPDCPAVAGQENQPCCNKVS